MKVRVPSRRSASAGKPGSSLLRQHLLSNNKINILQNIQVTPSVETVNVPENNREEPTTYDPVTPMLVDEEALNETFVVSF